MTSDERKLLLLLARTVVRVSESRLNDVETDVTDDDLDIAMTDVVGIEELADRIEAAGAAAADEERINDRG